MEARRQRIELRPVTLPDLVEIVGAGFRDFRAAPVFGLLIAGVYILAGWLLLALLFRFGMPYLVYPLAMGFSLVAPFALVGLYAVSSVLGRGERPTWTAILSAISQSLRRDLRWMALITGFSLVIWMDIAAFLLFAFVGVHGYGPNMLESILTSASGLLFLLLGNAAGALIAVTVFSISVISFPMLHDRDIDFITAMTTSVRLVMESPRAMLVWCAIIGLSMAIALASVLIGLLIVIPVIGHATWHLYRHAVGPQPAAEAA